MNNPFDHTVYIVTDGADFAVVSRDCGKELPEGLVCIPYSTLTEQEIRSNYVAWGFRDVTKEKTE